MGLSDSKESTNNMEIEGLIIIGVMLFFLLWCLGVCAGLFGGIGMRINKTNYENITCLN